MSTQQRNDDQTALAARLQRFWANLRQGKVVGYKVMAAFLILIAAVSCIWYIMIEKDRANSDLWREFEEANSVSALEEVSKKKPNSMQDKLARLQIARYQLGVTGIDQLGHTLPERRQQAIENIEKGRETLKTLLPEFNDDPVLKAECLLGLAQAESALVGVPVKEGQLTEFKGSVAKLVEYLDQLAATAPNTPWGTNAKKTADALRNDQSASEHEFVRVTRDLMQPLFGNFGQGEPQFPGGGLPTIGGLPGAKLPSIPGVAVPPPIPPKSPTPSGPVIEPLPPKAPAPSPSGPTPPTPGGPTPPNTGAPQAGTPGNIPPPIAPGPKAPEAKSPNAETPSPVAPGPKAPDSKAPMPAAPAPKAGEPKAGPTPPKP